jgi:uncharacterized delta-60 repeat protein
MALWRYTDEGQPVDGFPIVHHNAAGGLRTGDDRATALAPHPEGGVWVTGYSDGGSNNDMTLWRYTDEGQPVEGFPVHDRDVIGRNGEDRGYALALHPEGGVWVAGFTSVQNEATEDMALWRYTDDGQPVDGFPVVHHNAAGGGKHDVGEAIAAHPDGGVWVAGFSDNGSNADMVLWRYTDEGQPSEGFPTVHDDAGVDGAERGLALAQHPDGAVWVAGYSYNGGNNDMALWSFLSPDACPD